MNLLPFIIIALAAAALPLVLPDRPRLRLACVAALWLGCVTPLALHAAQVHRFITILNWTRPLDELTPDPQTTAQTLYSLMFRVLPELQRTWLPLIVVLCTAFLALALWPSAGTGSAGGSRAAWWRGAGAGLIGLSAGFWLCSLERSIVEVAEILGPDEINKEHRPSQPGDDKIRERTHHELKQYRPALVLLPFVALTVLALLPSSSVTKSSSEGADNI